MSRNLITTAGAGGGGSYTHPDCICQTIICAGDYKYVDTTQEGTKDRYVNPWITLASCTKVDDSNACFIELDFDFSKYQAVRLDALFPTVGTTCCEFKVMVGNEDGVACCGGSYQSICGTNAFNPSAYIGCRAAFFRTVNYMGMHLCLYRTASAGQLYYASLSGDPSVSDNAIIGFCFQSHSQCLCGGQDVGNIGYVNERCTSAAMGTGVDACMVWKNFKKIRFGRETYHFNCCSSRSGFGCYQLTALPKESRDV